MSRELIALGLEFLSATEIRVLAQGEKQMDLPSYFTDFLNNIRPTEAQKKDYQKGHKTLRRRLLDDEDLAPIIVDTFLQGSYRRATALRPEGDKRPDVDVITVTRLDRDEYAPSEAFKLFYPFLDKHYEGKWKLQGRSFGISLSSVDLDLVITSAPSEVEEEAYKSASVITEDTPEDVEDWRLVESWVALSKRHLAGSDRLLEAALKEKEWNLSPLYIPDREAEIWEPTHPLAQIAFTWRKNKGCNGHYVNVVKAMKWWRQFTYSRPKYPKGYPVEHLIGLQCPDGISSVAEGVTLAMEEIERTYQHYAQSKISPFVKDHGVEQNVFARVSGEDFALFHQHVSEAAKSAREALDSEDFCESWTLWRGLFGEKFPDAPPGRCDGDVSKKGGYTPRSEETQVSGGRFG